MRDVLRAPGALSLFLASCVARLPMGALGLLLVLHTQQITGSYAKGGLASGAYAIALGISNPALARVVDRSGQTLILRVGAPLAAAAIVVLAILPDGAPLAAIVACAAVAGASQPPVGACMRALWPVLLDTPDRRHAAYSMEGALLEVVYICGPVLIVAGIGSWSTSAAMLACATVLLVGDLAFAAHPISRAWRPHADVERDLTGALRGPGVRVLVAVFVLCGLSVGAVEVAVPAALDSTGHRELTGVLLGLWGVGSMFAGLAIGRLGAATNAPRRLAIALAAWGLAHGAVGISGEPLVLGLLLLVAGATIAPTFVSANGMLDDLAPTGTITEAFTWTSTGIAVGIAAGSAVAGALVEASSPAVAMAALGAGAVLASLVVRAAAAGPLRTPVPAPA
jgi:MFS family permease